MKTVTAAIWKINGKILLGRRPKGDKLQYMWEFPGGKKELGETPKECLHREIKEELGVNVEVGSLFCRSTHEGSGEPWELLSFYVFSEEMPAYLTAHDEIRWVDPNELLSYKLAPADLEIAQLLQKEACSAKKAPE